MNTVSTNAPTAMTRISTVAQWTRHVVETRTRFPNVPLDALLVQELGVMIGMSLTCDHLPNTNRNRFAFERVPADWNTIPSMVESMETPLNPALTTNQHVRHNRVVSSFMSMVMSMFDFVTRARERPKDRHVVVYVGVTTMKHVSMIRFIYEVMNMGPLADILASLYLIVDDNMAANMKRIMNPSESVVAYTGVEANAAISVIRQTYPSSVMTVVGSMPTNDDTLLCVKKGKVDYVCLDVEVRSLRDMNVVMQAVLEGNLVMDAVPLSDPSATVVRVSSAMVGTSTFGVRCLVRPAYWAVGALMNRYSNVVRPMNLDRMCYDCRAAYTIAVPVLDMLEGAPEGTNLQEGEDWTNRFAETITVTEEEL